MKNALKSFWNKIEGTDDDEGSVTILKKDYRRIKELASIGWAVESETERKKKLPYQLPQEWIAGLIDCGLPDITKIFAETRSGVVELAVSELQTSCPGGWTRQMPTAISLTSAILSGVGKLNDLPRSITIEFVDSPTPPNEPQIPGSFPVNV